MKIKLINPTLHDAGHATPPAGQNNPPVSAPPGARHVFTLGLDVDLHKQKRYRTLDAVRYGALTEYSRIQPEYD